MSKSFYFSPQNRGYKEDWCLLLRYKNQSSSYKYIRIFSHKQIVRRKTDAIEAGILYLENGYITNKRNNLL